MSGGAEAENAAEVYFNNRSMTREQQNTALEKRENEFNTYATSKTYQEGMLNTSLIQSQIGLIVSVISSGINGTFSGFQIALMVLLSISISLQFLIYVLLAMLAKSKKIDSTKKRCNVASINVAVTSLSGLLLIVTSAILSLTSYGVNSANVTTTPGITNQTS